MKVTEDELDSFIFSFGISSGPDVVICYSKSDQELYDSFYRKRSVDDTVIFRYIVIKHMRLDRSKIRKLLKESIENFSPLWEIRDRKIDDIIN